MKVRTILPAPAMGRRATLLAVSCAALLGVGQQVRAGDPKTWQADLAAFVREVDARYPFFDLKGIRKDWSAKKKELSNRVQTCRSDPEFLQIVVDAIGCLRDAHMGLRNATVRLPAREPQYYPGASFLPATDRRVIVMYPPRGLEKELPTGTIVTRIDGRDARSLLDARAEKAWRCGGPFSSPQRARLFEYRIPLRGRKGREHTIAYRSEGQTKSLVLRCTAEA